MGEANSKFKLQSLLAEKMKAAGWSDCGFGRMVKVSNATN